MPKIVISGYYGFNNIGDEAILEGMIDGIKKLREDVEIVVLSQHPEFTARKHKVKSIKRMSIWSIIKELKSCNLFVSGGGSLLQDVTSKRSILYYLGVIYISKLLKKKVMIYGQGIGPVNKAYNRYFVKRVLNKVDFINVRDNKSKQELLSMGVTKEILVTVDTVFGIKKPSLDEGKNILNDLQIDKNRKTVGISMRSWKNNKNIVNELKKTAEYLTDIGYNVLFIPCHFYSDLKIMKDVIKIVSEDKRKNVYLLNKYLYVKEYLSLIGNMEFLIGMRLHALIFSVLMGIPIIGISYDPKINNFVDMVQSKNLVNVDGIKFEYIKREIDCLSKNIDEAREKIESKRDDFCKMADNHNEILINFL